MTALDRLETYPGLWRGAAEIRREAAPATNSGGDMLIGHDLMRFFRRKPKEEPKLLCQNVRLFWWQIADHVDRTSPRGLL